MKVFKNAIWGVCFLAFIVALVYFFKFAINYSKSDEALSNNDSLKHEISLKVDKIVSKIKLEELKEDTGVYMVGTFENTTGYTLPKVRILYEITGSDGNILRQEVINLGRIEKNGKAQIKIAVGGMFNYSIRMTSDYNVGL